MRRPVSSNPLPERTRIFLVCSGLGNVHRGYEAFIRDCYEVLSREPSVDVWLFKGAGRETARDLTLRNLPRAGLGARILGELTRRGPYVIEQLSFALPLFGHIARERPDIVYYCDPSLGKALWLWRRATGRSFQLLLHNGGPHPPPFRWCDHVHQLTPVAANAARLAGHEPSRQTLLPCGVRIGAIPTPPSTGKRDAVRAGLGLPIDRQIVLSVGALNRGHKRMEYLITEVAALRKPRPFLVMLGQVEADTPAVRAMANLYLGHDGYLIRTVARREMDAYYRVADVFALASLTEAFGLGYVEAMSHGLPCIAHDYPIARFVLGDEGYLADLRRPGALAGRLAGVLALADTAGTRARRYLSVKSRFGWAALTPQYLAMFERCAQADLAAERPAIRLEAPAEAS